MLKIDTPSSAELHVQLDEEGRFDLDGLARDVALLIHLWHEHTGCSRTSYPIRPSEELALEHFAARLAIASERHRPNPKAGASTRMRTPEERARRLQRLVRGREPWSPDDT